MSLKPRELRLLGLYEFRLGHSATEAHRNICSAMGEDVVCYTTVTLWFKKFKEGSCELDDEPHPKRALAIDLDELKCAIDADPTNTTRDLAVEFQCSHTTIAKHLHGLGKTQKFGRWIPHQLSPCQLGARVNICANLLSYKRNFNWLTNIVTADEKWVMYTNHTRRRQWLAPGEEGKPTPKPELYPRKVMLCVWWGCSGVIHWELLPECTTVTAELYCEQLDRVARKLRGKQDKVYYLHDNAKPHVAKTTNKKILELSWTLVPHPAYSPDMAPTDYHLFRSLQNHMEEKISTITRTSKWKWKTFFKINLQNSTPMESNLYQQDGNTY